MLAFSSICRMLSVYCALQVPENTGIGRLFTRLSPFEDIFKRQEGSLPINGNISSKTYSKYALSLSDTEDILKILVRFEQNKNVACSWPILSLANQMDKKVYCPSPNWCLAKVKFFGWYDVVSQCFWPRRVCIFHLWPFTHTIGVSSINLQLCMAVSANL